MLRGLTTVVYPTPDLAAAKRWYTEVLGIEPYFDRTAYVEFRTGDHEHELGLLDTSFAGELAVDPAAADTTPGVPTPAAPGVIVYWHVDDVQAALDRLTALGATLHHPARDFGEGFVGAAVLDPFGNVLGIMRNPHYLDVLARTDHQTVR
ncbi:VOC family protein [Sanguibacter sp. 25GB23B1]|uniref:VOC family protein n=1 Tax=unclassified Sanguibacter TaxID=2645534 RepID=UPI0032AE99C8